MFTGIVEGLARVEQVTPLGGAYRLALDLGGLAEDVAVGDSVAIDGVCLTATAVGERRVEFDVIRETIERTAFATLRVGGRVNVERSMRADSRFHGHFVSGHVDCAGRIALKRAEPGQVKLEVEVPPRYTGLMVEKGSIAIDGISLTLTEVTDTTAAVALIPHTLEVTTLEEKASGDLVNVELDPMAKWVHRLLEPYLPPEARQRLSADAVRKAGFGGEGGRIIRPD